MERRKGKRNTQRALWFITLDKNGIDVRKRWIYFSISALRTFLLIVCFGGLYYGKRIRSEEKSGIIDL